MISIPAPALDDLLHEINDKLRSLDLLPVESSDRAAAEREELREERDAILQCMNTYAGAFRYANRIHLESVDAGLAAKNLRLVTAPAAPEDVLAEQAVSGRRRASGVRPGDAGAGAELGDRHQESCGWGIAPPDEPVAKHGLIQENKPAVRKSHVFESVVAAPDACQVVVTGRGDLVSAKRITAEARSTQLLGQMSDAALQQLSWKRRIGVARKSTGGGVKRDGLGHAVEK